MPFTSPASWKQLAKWTMSFIYYLTKPNPLPTLSLHLRGYACPKNHSQPCWRTSCSIHDLRVSTPHTHSQSMHSYLPRALFHTFSLLQHPTSSLFSTAVHFTETTQAISKDPHTSNHPQIPTTCICNHYCLPTLIELCSYRHLYLSISAHVPSYYPRTSV